jgi:formate C-acetyltransferase
VNFLIQEKQKDQKNTSKVMTEDNMRLREELAEQIRALKELKEMANSYGFDISQPAKNAAEAFQFVYFGYLAAIK